MTNQFVKVGQLLIDLNRDLTVKVSDADLDEVKMEFIRIKSRLMMIWSVRPPELLYVLEFHSAEAYRLLAKCKKLQFDGVGKGKVGAGDDGLFRVEVYKALFAGLLGVIAHLELLKEGKNMELRLGGFGLGC